MQRITPRLAERQVMCKNTHKILNMHKKRRQFLSQNIIGVSVSNLRFYFFSLRYLFTRRLLNSVPKPLADYKAIHKIHCIGN